MASKWGLIKKNSACGPDGVHPSLQEYFNPENPQDKERITRILLSALQRPDFFSSRPSLIPKKVPGQFRPLQVLNVPLRLLEKVLADHIRTWKLDNSEDFHGFVRGKGTHTAFTIVKQALDDTNEPLLFIDYTKAYNLVDRKVLTDIIEKKCGDDYKSIIKQVVSKQNIAVMSDRYVTDRGVPQGSAISPLVSTI